MKIIIDNNYGWKKTKLEGCCVYYTGSFKELLPSIKKIIELGEYPQTSSLDFILNKLTAPSSAIIDLTHTVIAFVDHFCCYPLFYTVTGDSAISNNARRLSISDRSRDWDILSVEEFSMTGYVPGSDTLIQGLKKLQSGESMIVNRSNNIVNISRYYRYYSAGDESRSDDDWVDELDVIMNNITQRMIDRAEERPIRVPLSAGLDSRVLVCKLHEAGYNDLEVFSYGPPGNWEARGAQTIAKRLDIPWRSVVINRKEAHQMFWSSEREKYWNFADGLSALPNFQEYYPISKLHSMGVLPENSILINGQSGDFITGGHVPKTLIQSDANVRTLLDIIIEKHYALWTNLMTIDRLERVEEKILKLLGVSIDTELTAEELVSLYERWECEERQVKWVIHGQRVYDFFGYDWQLPLWDIELARFYQRVPIHLKLDQYLYRSWLERWNYKGLFLDFNPSVWRWPGVSLAVVPLAKGVEMLLGGRAKRKWYKMFYYFGHSSDHYAPYSYSEYFQARNLIRNSTSLNGRVWARENYLPRELVDLGQ